MGVATGAESEASPLPASPARGEVPGEIVRNPAGQAEDVEPSDAPISVPLEQGRIPPGTSPLAGEAGRGVARGSSPETTTPEAQSAEAAE